MESRTIVLLVGESGVGKSTLARHMVDKYGWKEVVSYTTRLPRTPDEDTHIFVNDAEFDELMDYNNICAYTEFDGHRYCATDEQVDECDIYVIDPDGVEYFYDNYKGRKVPVVVYLEGDKELLINRMKARGDSVEKISARLLNDEIKFAGFYDMLNCTGLDHYSLLVDEYTTTNELGVYLENIRYITLQDIRREGAKLP